jgi:GNAT superfamily N-acetyltransferase
MRVESTESVPPNFDEFVDEIALGVGGIYGEKAAEMYRTGGRDAVQATIDHPDVDAWCAFDGPRATALLFAVRRPPMGQIPFLHVLRDYSGHGAEALLVERAIQSLRSHGMSGILYEQVSLCPLDLSDTFGSLGFEHVCRALMTAPLAAPPLLDEDLPAGELLDEAGFPDAAAAIVAAYASHPGQRLHAEVRSTEAATDFLLRTRAGEFGFCAPEFVRAEEREGHYAGVVVGCEIAPECGFVLQVAVEPRFQSQGIGTRLLRQLARAFTSYGLTRIALGVTLESPAVGLYRRLGFSVLRPVDAYVWWSNRDSLP